MRRQTRGLYLLLGLFVAFVWYNYPFIAGKMFADSDDPDSGFFHRYHLSYHIRIPDYAQNAAQWINSQPDLFRILLLPDKKTNVYDWGFGGAGDVTLELFNKGIMFRQYGEGMAPPSSIEDVYNYAISLLYERPAEQRSRFIDVLRMLNVKYILLRSDFVYDFYGDNDSPAFLRSRLREQTGITRSKRFGKWEFYEISGVASRVQAFNAYTIWTGPTGPTPEAVAGLAAATGPVVYMSPKQYARWGQGLSAKMEPSKAQHKNNRQNCRPDTRFQQMSSTHYRVTIEQAACSFLLILNSSYHAGWQAFESGAGRRQDTPVHIQAGSHVIVNGYANGWLVGESEQPHREFEFEYRPQDFVRYGTLISIVVVCSMVLAWIIWRAMRARRS